MSPSFRRFSTFLVMAALLVMAGCTAPFEPEPTSTGSVAVEMLLHGDQLEVISLVGASAPGRPPPTRGDALRWELRDVGGVVVASGEVDDPRIVRAEHDLSQAEELVAEVGRLRVVVPAIGGRLVVFEREGEGWTPLGDVVVPAPAADGTLEQNLIRASEDLVGPPTLIHAATGEHALHLLVVGEGYREAELEGFRRDAELLTQQLLAVEGFADHAAEVAVYRQDLISDETGLADPQTGVDPVTAFEVGYGDDVTRPRRCMLFEPAVGAAAMAALRDRTLAVRADAVVILVNTDDYGGCASPADRVVTASRHPSSAAILAHELGHTVFGLSDEYEHGACGAYPDGPNVAPSVDALPWSDLVNTSSLPTSDAAPWGTVGAFEGANHCTAGLFRPTHACRMRELGDGFCPVCLREVDRFFARRGQNQRGAVTIENRTGVGLFVRCPHQPGPGCSDWTYLQPGDTERLQTTGDGWAFVADAQLADGSTISWRTLVPGRDRVSVYANAADPLSP